MCHKLVDEYVGRIVGDDCELCFPFRLLFCNGIGIGIGQKTGAHQLRILHELTVHVLELHKMIESNTIDCSCYFALGRATIIIARAVPAGNFLTKGFLLPTNRRGT